jgi:hypothetical protein
MERFHRPITSHFHRRFPDGVTLPGAALPGFKDDDKHRAMERTEMPVVPVVRLPMRCETRQFRRNSVSLFRHEKQSWKARPRPFGLRYGQDNVIPKQFGNEDQSDQGRGRLTADYPERLRRNRSSKPRIRLRQGYGRDR